MSEVLAKDHLCKPLALDLTLRTGSNPQSSCSGTYCCTVAGCLPQGKDPQGEWHQLKKMPFLNSRFFLINKQTHCNPRLKFGQRDSGHPGLPPITGTREAHMALDTKPSNQLDESRDIHVPLEFWCLPCQDIQASPGTWKTKQLGVQLHRDKLPPLAKGPLQHLQLPLGDVLPQQGVRQVACLLLLEVALVRLHHWVTGLPLIAHGRIADAWASCQKQILIQSIEWRNGETQ